MKTFDARRAAADARAARPDRAATAIVHDSPDARVVVFRLARAHWWVSNVGLGVLAAGFAAAPRLGPSAAPLLAAGGVLSALGAYCFIYNLWRTIDGRQARRRGGAPVAPEPPAQPPRRPGTLPVLSDAPTR